MYGCLLSSAATDSESSFCKNTSGLDIMSMNNRQQLSDSSHNNTTNTTQDSSLVMNTATRASKRGLNREPNSTSFMTDMDDSGEIDSGDVYRFRDYSTTTTQRDDEFNSYSKIPKSASKVIFIIFIYIYV